MPTARSAAFLLALVGLLTACEQSRTVSVRVSMPGLDSAETPVPGVVILALPYDRDSLLAAFAAQASTPRPSTAAIDSAFAEFRGPFVAFSLAAYRASKLRDTVGMLETRLKAHSAGSAEYEEVRRHRERAADSLRAAEARRDHARLALDSARATVLPRADSLRRVVHAWEDSTYRDWDRVVQKLTIRRKSVVDTTDESGRLQLKLPPGRWWISARSWDVSDPNAEWYWNLPVTADTIVLSSATGRRQPRY